MSWDVMIMNAAGTPASLENLPDDWRPNPLGTAPAVRLAITKTLPTTDWTDPAWGLADGPGFSFEFNLQADGDVEAFTIHVRGGGEPVPAIVALCRENSWVAFDYSTGELIDLDDPSAASWERFQTYRDRILREAP